MPSKNIIQYNDFRVKILEFRFEIRFQKEQSANKQQSIKRSLFGRSFCCVASFQSAEKSLRSTNHRIFYFLQPCKKGSKKIKNCGSPSSHTLYPSFVVATLSATQTRKKNAGQCLRPPPLVFWRLLYRQPSTSIGTLTLILIICSADALLVRLPLHAPIPTPPKKGLSV
jgi:hypothetical protein